MKPFAQFAILPVMFTIWGLAIAAGFCGKKDNHE
jgi:hypothetical protein